MAILSCCVRLRVLFNLATAAAQLDHLLLCVASSLQVALSEPEAADTEHGDKSDRDQNGLRSFHVVFLARLIFSCALCDAVIAVGGAEVFQ